MAHGIHFTAHDPEQFQAQIFPLSGPCRVRPAAGTRFNISITAHRLTKISLFIVRAPSVVVDTPPPHTHYGLNIPLGKPFDAVDGDRRHCFSKEVHLFTPERHMHVEGKSDLRALAVKLNSAEVDNHAFKLSGSRKPFKPVTDNRLSQSIMSRALLSGIASLWSDIQRNDEAAANNSINLAEAQDALLTYFVLANQDNSKTDKRRPAPASMSVIAQAEEYLCAHLTQPVSRAELAATLGIGIRTLSRGFSRRWGTGPMGFLKVQRMLAVYREILGADAEVTSVTDIAYRYGFTHLGRFAGEYLRMFGESPSQTLKH